MKIVSSLHKAMPIFHVCEIICSLTIDSLTCNHQIEPLSRFQLILLYKMSYTLQYESHLHSISTKAGH